MTRLSSNTEKVQAFILIYVLMALLWLLGHFMATEVSVKRIQILNSFECPSDGKIRNEYDCTRPNLEKGSVYPFFFENTLSLFDLNLSLRIFRQTGKTFNEDRTETIRATFKELQLDSYGKVKTVSSQDLTLTFECKANTWICGPVPVMVENRFPAGKHYYLLDFKDHAELWKTVKNAEIIMENFDQDYQRYVVLFKLGMLVLALIGGSLYYLSLKKINRSSWSVEQTWVLLLTGAVLCFNDPFSLLYYCFGFTFFLFFSKIVLIVGLSLVTPFWIASLRSLRQKPESRFLTSKETIYAAVGAFLQAICTLFLADTSSVIFSGSKLFNLCTAGIMIYQVVQNLWSYNKLLWVDKLYMLITLYFAAAFYGLVYGWQTPIDAYSRNYAKALAIICLFTIYSLMCQFLYVPRKETMGPGLDDSISVRKAYDKLEEDIEKDEFTSA